MLEKNQFLIFNHVLSELYRCRTYQDLGDAFLPMLRMLIPYRYASIMRRAEAGPSIHLVDPLCVPAAFAEAERRYMLLCRRRLHRLAELLPGGHPLPGERPGGGTEAAALHHLPGVLSAL